MRKHDEHDEFGGLHRDLLRIGGLIDRRRLLRFAASAGAIHLFGCGESTDADEANDDPPETVCERIPEETAGPFPADGSNGPNVLDQPGVVRGYISESFGSATGLAGGHPLMINLTIVSASTCAPLAGHAVYLWHCDRAGRYSLYSDNVTDENYLRGVQAADASGKVAFSSIFPGCYEGRWPHIHIEVFPSLAAATNVANKIATSQIALPKLACTRAYTTDGYQPSLINLTSMSLETDSVFSDGSDLQLAAVGGSPLTVFTARLTIAV